MQSTRGVTVSGTALVLAAVFLFQGKPVPKQHGNDSLKYDTKAEVKLKGTVEDVKQSSDTADKSTVLIVNTSTTKVEVYLCPRAFLESMSMDFKNGDEVEVSGSKIKHGDGEIVLAREVVKGTDTLTLREVNGTPLWRWRNR